MFKSYETELAGRKLVIENRKNGRTIKRKCNSGYGETVVMVKCNSIKRTKRRNRLFSHYQ